MIVDLINHSRIENVFSCDFWIEEGTAYISICYRNQNNKLVRYQTEVYNIVVIVE